MQAKDPITGTPEMDLTEASKGTGNLFESVARAAK